MSDKSLFFLYFKAQKKSGKAPLVAPIEAKNADRAKREAENLLEDEGHDPADYFKVAMTDTPVVDDLPETGCLCNTWCDRYVLQDDKKTWLPFAGSGGEGVDDDNDGASDDDSDFTSVLEMTPAQQVASHWLYGLQHLSPEDMQTVLNAMSSQDAEHGAMNITVDVLIKPEILQLTDILARVHYPESGCSSTMRGVLVGLIKKIWRIGTPDAVDLSTSDLQLFVEEYAQTHSETRAELVEKWIAAVGLESADNTTVARVLVSTMTPEQQIAAETLYNSPEIDPQECEDLAAIMQDTAADTLLNALVFAFTRDGLQELINSTASEEFTPYAIRVELVQCAKVIWGKSDTPPKWRAARKFATQYLIASAGAERAAVLDRWVSSPENDDGSSAAADCVPFRTRIARGWLFDKVETAELTAEEVEQARSSEMDMDQTYLQNVLLAMDAPPSLKHALPEHALDIQRAIKAIWPVDGGVPTIALVCAFVKEHHEAAPDKRQGIYDKWFKKYGRITDTAPTDTDKPGAEIIPDVEAPNPIAMPSSPQCRMESPEADSTMTFYAPKGEMVGGLSNSLYHGLLVAAVQGLCANPVYSGIRLEEIPCEAVIIADRAFEIFGQKFQLAEE